MSTNVYHLTREQADVIVPRLLGGVPSHNKFAAAVEGLGGPGSETTLELTDEEYESLPLGRGGMLTVVSGPKKGLPR
jgi:hypothetical protein